MKARKFWYTWLIGFVYLVSAVFYACSKDDDTVPDNPSKEDVGKVEFNIVNDGGTGSGSIDSPAVVEQGDTLDMAISQKSSYTDPNGSVFVCEPKATIKLYAKKDTLYAKDLRTLISVTESSNESSEKAVTSNLREKKTLQKFNVGGQEITFDLTHEIYNYLNSQNKNIEMPYIKVNSAKYGAVETSEETETRATTTVRGIRITPCHPQTRGTIVDSTTYDVNVAFNLELESVHTTNAAKQNLSFEVNYVAVVESVTEFADPLMDYRYKLEIISGTDSEASPFVKKKGETLSLLWRQINQYSYFSIEDRESQTLNHEPRATVSLDASADTVWVTDESDINKVTATEPIITETGENPIVTTGNISFNIGGQVITVNWSYDAFKDAQIGDYYVIWPYLTLSTPEVVDVSVSEVAGAKVPNKEAKLYEVTARIRQHLETKNVPESERISQDVEYVVKYFAALEVKLTGVKYRKGFEWLSPHDNLPLRSRYIVYRDRTYSTGETFTDTFYSLNYSIAYLASPEIRGGGSYHVDNQVVMFDGETINYHKEYYDNDEIWRTHCISYVRTGVPDLTKVRLGTPIDQSTYGNAWGEFDKYVDATSSFFDSQNPKEDWYACKIARGGVQTVYAEYNDIGCWEDLRMYEVFIACYDRFLYIDGQMITFEEYRPVYEMNVKEEDTTMPDGSPAKVFTNEVKAKYLGRDFYAATVDTVYQYSNP